MELKNSGVIFNAENHTYHLNGVQLKGITGYIKEFIFPNQYDGIPKHILEKAAERGHFVHSVCEIIDDLGVEHPSIEGRNYLSLLDKHQLRHVASEYIVTDKVSIASPIDKVYQTEECKENEFILGDIKTTYTLNIPYLEWQLSIYARLFEKQNKGAKVKKLIGIWLRDEQAKIEEINRIPNKHIDKMLKCIQTGVFYECDYVRPNDNTLPATYSEVEREIAKLALLKDEVTKRYDELKDTMMQAMVKAGEYRWDGKQISVIRKSDTTRKNFDKARFEKEHPELYKQYVTETPVVGSIMIKVDKQFEEEHEIQFITSLRSRKITSTPENTN